LWCFAFEGIEVIKSICCYNDQRIVVFVIEQIMNHFIYIAVMLKKCSRFVMFCIWRNWSYQKHILLQWSKNCCFCYRTNYESLHLHCIENVVDLWRLIVYVLIFDLFKARQSKCNNLQPHAHDFCLDIFKFFIGPPIVSHDAKLLPFFFSSFTRKLWKFSSIYKKTIKNFIQAHKDYWLR